MITSSQQVKVEVSTLTTGVFKEIYFEYVPSLIGLTIINRSNVNVFLSANGIGSQAIIPTSKYLHTDVNEESRDFLKNNSFHIMVEEPGEGICCIHIDYLRPDITHKEFEKKKKMMKKMS